MHLINSWMSPLQDRIHVFHSGSSSIRSSRLFRENCASRRVDRLFVVLVIRLLRIQSEHDSTTWSASHHRVHTQFTHVFLHIPAPHHHYCQMSKEVQRTTLACEEEIRRARSVCVGDWCCYCCAAGNHACSSSNKKISHYFTHIFDDAKK